MTTPIEDRIKRVMSAEADQLHPPPNLAETVIIRGRRARRTQRVGLGVAIVSGIVAAAVLPGTLIQSGPQQPAKTPTPAPTKHLEKPAPPFMSLPKGSLPRIHYTVGTTTVGGYLYDGTLRVRIAPGVRFDVVSRVDGGWLAYRSDSKSNGRLGIKRQDGSFKPLGASDGARTAVSKDGKQVVAPFRDANGRTRIGVTDVATGQRTASTPVDSFAEVIGWNAYGIWFVRLTPTGLEAPTYVWQPGTVPKRVPDPGSLQIERSPTRMVRLPDNSPCAEVVTLGSINHLEVVRRFCVDGLDIDSASVSPDGRVILLPDGSARPIDGGKVVPTRTPAGMSLFMRGEAAAWEDNDHVLVSESGRERPFTWSEVRCNVRTGRCGRAFDQRPAPGTFENGTGYFSIAAR